MHYRKSFGLIGSVPGVPGGVPGTIGRGISTQGASWAVGEVKPALSVLAKPPTKARAARGGKNPKGERWKEFPSGKEESYS